MPRLPLAFTQRPLSPTQQPRPVVQVPVERTPLVSPAAASAAAQGAVALGAGAARGGELLLEGSAIQARRRESHDILSAREALQGYRGEADRWKDAVEREADPFDAPEQLDQRLKDLTLKFAEPLTPGARQRFEIEAQKYANIVLGKSRDTRALRMDAQRQFVYGTEITEIAQRITQESSPVIRQQLFASLETLVQDGIPAGLVTAAQGLKMLQTTRDAVAVADEERRIQLDPEAETARLTALLEQGQTHIGNVRISDLVDKAEAEHDETVRRDHNRDIRLAQQMDKRHGLNEGDLLNRIVEAQTLEALDLLKHEVQMRGLDRTSQGLSEDGHRRLLGAVLSRERALTSPRAESDPVALRQWQTTLHVDRGRRPPDEIRTLQAQVMADPNLATQDANTLAEDFGQELDAAHYSKLPDYASTKSEMLQSFQTTNPFDPFDEDGALARNFATRFFNEELAKIVATQGPTAANDALFRLADEAKQNFSSRILESIKRRLHVPPSIPPGIFERPVNLESMTTDDSKRRYLDALDKIEQGFRSGRFTYNEATSYSWQVQQRNRWERRVLRDRGAQTPTTPSQQGSSRLERARREAVERGQQINQQLQQQREAQ